MNDNYEYRILKRVIKLINDPGREINPARTFKICLAVMSALTGVAAFLLVDYGFISATLGIALAIFSGAIGCTAGFISMSIKQFSVLQPHFDRNSIEKRIRDLET